MSRRGLERDGVLRATATMSGAWVALARTGDPGWPPHTLAGRETVIFDRGACAAARDPFEAVHALWAS